MIELLVVISIIGTLSGMVMVTFKGTTQKAKIARGQSFSASVQNILGAECLGAWNFNEGSGTTAINSMGINHGTILGGAAYSPDTPNGSAASGGYSLNFDGSDDYVAVSANLTGGLRQITIEAWVNADRASSMVFTTGNAVILHFRGAGFYLTAEDGTISNDPAELAAMNAHTTMWSPYTSRMIFSDWAVEDGSFLRLNTLTLGYTLPKSLLNKARIESLRFYVTGYNVALWTNYSGYDPEVSTIRRTNLSPGVDYSAYPRSRQLVFGVNLNF